LAEDLGTWPPEQATVLVEALQQAGLSPEARRTRDGIVVTVPDEQSDDAHRTLVSNMDAIARAARPPSPSGGRRRRPRPAAPARPSPSSSSEGGGLGSERLLRLARPLGLLLLVVMLAAVVRNPLVMLVALAALVYWLGRQAQRRNDGDDERRRW
jgi:hypothetical protein